VFKDITFALWFLLPAAIANVTPILAAHLPLLQTWNAPLDGGHQYKGKDIFGKHKTWRGIITGTLAALVVFALQQHAYDTYTWAKTISAGVNYTTLPFLLGPLLGIGALGGDAAKSFFKRRLGIEAGKTWFPFDQLDYIFGAILVSLPFVVLPVRFYLWMLVLWFIVHLAASYVGWLLHLKDEPI
jgi:CDP-2,3-bis-(O-geranylgeranyl)-sn-glycerol synthase